MLQSVESLLGGLQFRVEYFSMDAEVAPAGCDAPRGTITDAVNHTSAPGTAILHPRTISLEQNGKVRKRVVPPSMLADRGGMFIVMRRDDARYRGGGGWEAVLEFTYGAMGDGAIEAVPAGHIRLGDALDIGRLAGKHVVVWQEAQPDGIPPG
jgi:hypothetical protein